MSSTLASGSAFVWLTIVKVVVFFTLLLTITAFVVLFERKMSGFIQDRSGPNRVGPWGLLQSVADGLKFIFKEELWPIEATRPFYLLGPVLAMVPATILFAVIPFGSPLPTPWGLTELIVADAPIGLLYVLAIASIGVYGVVMAGWASNSKYSFLGGLRGSAQLISYEVGLGLSLVPVLLFAGDVRMPELVSMQQGAVAGGPPTAGLWFAFPLALAFFFFFVAGLAECNRLPFDLPEAESELIAGYHTEYSSMKFAMFFLGEYAHMLTTACLVTIFFLGGWDIPFWAGDNIRVLANGQVLGDPTWWKTLLTLACFTVKTAGVLTVFVWIRWTLPRFRYDQLMDLGWKIFIPSLLVYLLVMAGAILVLDDLGLSTGIVYSAILFALNLLMGGILVFVLDRGVLIRGAGYRAELRTRRERAEGRRGSRLTEGFGGPVPAARE